MFVVLFANGDIHHILGHRPRNKEKRQFSLAKGHIQSTRTLAIALLNVVFGQSNYRLWPTAKLVVR
jgi:hypothetical protein